MQDSTDLAPPNELKPGDKVTTKAGGFVWSVVIIRDGFAVCERKNINGRMVQGTFSLEEVERAE
jgi:hypothetical protein